MSNVTAEMIKELRERTGVGMSKCKDALVRGEGSIDKAIEILRKEGMASAVKKEGRETKDGFIAAEKTDSNIGLVEINCETDFVAKNEAFANFLKNVSLQIAIEKPESLDALLAAKYIEDKAVSVEDYRNLMVQKFGENIQVKRIEVIERAENASYGIYKHMGGKIVTIVEISGAKNVEDLAKEIAMHVAAAAPDYLSKEDISSDVLEKEKEIARSQIKNKPANVIDKIVEGKLNAFYEAACLLKQKYIKDTTVSVEQFVKSSGVKENLDLSITRFWYWKIGL